MTLLVGLLTAVTIFYPIENRCSYQVKSGDLIAIRTKGRLEVGEVMVTKKERYRVQLTRYI